MYTVIANTVIVALVCLYTTCMSVFEHHKCHMTIDKYNHDVNITSLGSLHCYKMTFQRFTVLLLTYKCYGIT